MQDCFQLYHNVEDYIADYIRRHDANNDNVDAETNWLTDHNHYSSFFFFLGGGGLLGFEVNSNTEKDKFRP